MKLHINDANILIDICQLDLVNAFLALDFELYTTDFVFEELHIDQQALFDNPSLRRITSTEEALNIIYSLTERFSGLSFEDCSVLHYAHQMNGVLVTGDGKLRRAAAEINLEVKGIIYIIEQIKIQQILDTNTCIEKLTELRKVNSRLPMAEIDSRISLWRQETD